MDTRLYVVECNINPTEGGPSYFAIFREGMIAKDTGTISVARCPKGGVAEDINGIVQSLVPHLYEGKEREVARLVAECADVVGDQPEFFYVTQRVSFQRPPFLVDIRIKDAVLRVKETRYDGPWEKIFTTIGRGNQLEVYTKLVEALFPET